jgi:hypothetical protein
MESTVVGLELYFEHRNYLAAIFLFLPIASGLYLLRSKIDTKLVHLIVILILLILSFFTYERAKLWGILRHYSYIGLKSHQTLHVHKIRLLQFYLSKDDMRNQMSF